MRRNFRKRIRKITETGNNENAADYIKVNVLNFPVFNLYDILITLGALSIVLWLVKDKTMEIQEIKNVEEDDLYRDL